jgi:hypothetical protein
MLFYSFFDFGTGWIIAAIWTLDCMYPPLLWSPKFGCPWFVAPLWMGIGGGGDASYAIDLGTPAYP